MPFPLQKAIRGINLDQDPSADSSLQLATVFHIVVVCSCVLCNCDVLEWRAQIVSLVPHWLLSTGVNEVARVQQQYSPFTFPVIPQYFPGTFPVLVK